VGGGGRGLRWCQRAGDDRAAMTKLGFGGCQRNFSPLAIEEATGVSWMEAELVTPHSFLEVNHNEVF
jgi:hypothetical protein